MCIWQYECEEGNNPHYHMPDLNKKCLSYKGTYINELLLVIKQFQKS